MTPDDILKRLINNALEFLNRALVEIELQPKHSLISFSSSIELVLKARLMAEHWSLVISRKQEADWEKLISGDFQSVTPGEALTRLEKVVLTKVPKNEVETFKKIATHRNKIIHFYHEEEAPKTTDEFRQNIVKEQLKGWYHLHRLLTEQWKDVFNPWQKDVRKIDTEFRKLTKFLEVVFEHKSKEIENLKKQGNEITQCPSCQFDSQVHETQASTPYDAECLVCNGKEPCIRVVCEECTKPIIFRNEGFFDCPSCEEQYEPEKLAELLSPTQYHSNDGDLQTNGNCGDCEGRHTVIRTPDDDYFCTSCFGRFSHLQSCDFCGEPNTADMESSYYKGCSECDGSLGWDND